MNTLSNIGRYLFAIPFGVFGINHFLNATAMAGYVPGYIPGGAFWIYLTGIILLAACISIIIEKKTRLISIILATMLIIFILTIHLPGLFSPEMMQMSLTNLLKDTALAGGALYIAGHYYDTDLEVE